MNGKKDPKFGECVLVPLDKAPEHGQFPKVYTPLSIPNTFYRYEKASGRVQTMVTVMPNDLHVVWFTCGACSSDFHVCQCKQGLTTPRSIEVIHDQIVAEQAGEEWSVHHPNYMGSKRRTLRTGVSKPHWNEGGRVITPSSRKAAEPSTKPAKKGLTRRKPGQEPPAEYDIDKINKAAASSADESTKALERKLSKKSKSVPQKKSKLTRKKNK